MNHRPPLTEFIPLRAVVAPRMKSEIRAVYKHGDSVFQLQVAMNASPGPPSPNPLGPGHGPCQQMQHIPALQP
jgi:hypothetical protein